MTTPPNGGRPPGGSPPSRPPRRSPGGGRGGDPWDDWRRLLEEGVNDLAVIRTTLETRDMFPDDEALKAELQPMVTSARESVRQHLESARRELTGSDDGLQERLDEVLAMLGDEDSYRKAAAFDPVFRAYTALCWPAELGPPPPGLF
jgi:hypothetical protein